MFRASAPSRFLAAATVAAGLLSAPAARAFCRATPCDPASGACKTDAHGCATEGPKLYWPEGRIALSVDGGGSTLRGISGADAVAAVSEALGAWQTAECAGGAHPSLKTKVTQIAAGAKADFNGDGPNESVVLFIDTAWLYESKAVAKTTVGMNLDTGEILDADIQLDSERFDLAYDTDAGGIDVVAVLTHEIGHVLGLGHSDVPGATMQPETTGFGTVELRSLESDDEKGICTIYPPGKPPSAQPDTTEAPSGNSTSGCSIGGRASSGTASLVAVACAVGMFRRRRIVRAPIVAPSNRPS